MEPEIFMNAVEACAKAAHEVNRAYCQFMNDDSQLPWDDAPEWARDSARNGARFHIKSGFSVTPEQSHENWLEQKRREGWKYGDVKDVEKKEHPCFRPYDELPPMQQAKDKIFSVVVKTVWDSILAETAELTIYDKRNTNGVSNEKN